MKGVIRVRKDLKKPWYYVRWYDEQDGKKYDITSYRGMKMYDRFYAERLLSQMQGDYERGVFNIQKYLTGASDVPPLLYQWLESVEHEVSEGTLNNYKGYVKHHLEPFFVANQVQLHEVQFDILKQLKKAVAAKLAPKGVWNVMNCMHVFMRYCHESGRIVAMPAFPRKGTYGLIEPTIKWITEDRQMAIINAMPEQHRPIFLFLKYHPRRPSEAMVLKMEDYDPREQMFTIQRGISYGKEVKHTKTRAVHYLPCHKDFIPVLEHMPRPYPFSPYVFTCKESHHRHKRYTKDILARLWKEACAKAGEDIRMYSGLKHSTCSQYLNVKGLSPEELRDITDHASVESVRRYGKLELARKRELLNRPDPQSTPKVINLTSRKKG